MVKVAITRDEDIAEAVRQALEALELEGAYGVSLMLKQG